MEKSAASGDCRNRATTACAVAPIDRDSFIVSPARFSRPPVRSCRTLDGKCSSSHACGVGIRPDQKIDRPPKFRAEHAYTERRIVRTWGRRRLALLEPVLPFAERVDVYLKGRALPSFYAVKLPGITFVLGLSGWTAQRWTSAASFDLLVAPDEAATVRERALAALGARYAASALDLATEVGVAGGVDDVDLHPPVGQRDVLGEDRDPALALQLVGVEDALPHQLRLAELSALAQQRVEAVPTARGSLGGGHEVVVRGREREDRDHDRGEHEQPEQHRLAAPV